MVLRHHRGQGALCGQGNGLALHRVFLKLFLS
jgi:hypothetical protein